MGTRPLDWEDDEWTTRFEVEAEATRKIEVLPVSQARSVTFPGTVEGAGNDVSFAIGGQVDTAFIVGNPEGRFLQRDAPPQPIRARDSSEQH